MSREMALSNIKDHLRRFKEDGDLDYHAQKIMDGYRHLLPKPSANLVEQEVGEKPAPQIPELRKVLKEIQEESRQLYWWARQHPKRGERVNLEEMTQMFANKIISLIQPLIDQAFLQGVKKTTDACVSTYEAEKKEWRGDL